MTQWIAAITLALCAPMLAFATEAAEPEYPQQPVNKRIDNNLNKRIGEKERPSRRRGQRGGMKQFRDDKGNLTITNIPDKYKRRKDYVEVNIHYNPIVIPAKYKKAEPADKYVDGNIAELVAHYSKMYVLDEKLVHAVIRAESGGNPYAVSSAGARGLMQLMPETAADMGVEDIFDPAQNIAGGTQYLAKMMNLFNNDIELALAAYNAGPNAVKEHGGIPPYPETQQYVKTVCAYAGKNAKLSKYHYGVKGAKPTANTLPGGKKRSYTIHFFSGYTQPADKVIDENPYYYVQYGNKTWLIRKDHVAKIEEPA